MPTSLPGGWGFPFSSSLAKLLGGRGEFKPGPELFGPAGKILRDLASAHSPRFGHHTDSLQPIFWAKVTPDIHPCLLLTVSQTTSTCSSKFNLRPVSSHRKLHLTLSTPGRLCAWLLLSQCPLLSSITALITPCGNVSPAGHLLTHHHAYSPGQGPREGLSYKRISVFPRLLSPGGLGGVLTPTPI